MEEVAGVDVVVADQASVAFVERWEVLVSTTNWEKGRIIHEWREALKTTGAAAPQYSDEAWSRRVGSVSGQHVGRLRRVHERFGPLRESFGKLAWSHFCASLEWHDAELWLEGAAQNAWSVSEMRRQRWEAFGAVEADRPAEADVVSAEIDEDFVPFETSAIQDVERAETPVAGDFVSETFGDSAEESYAPQGLVDAEHGADEATHDSGEDASAPVRLFEHVGDLPADMQQAFEAFKLSIIQHKLNGWSEVQPADVLAALDGLKQLAQTAPHAN
ncbi:MAG: hypothetical protein JNM18_04850 [Planctomycetaceae bacterium]|nr:hypothetical protein [Planctomycetaceae bacterium]